MTSAAIALCGEEAIEFNRDAIARGARFATDNPSAGVPSRSQSASGKCDAEPFAGGKGFIAQGGESADGNVIELQIQAGILASGDRVIDTMTEDLAIGRCAFKDSSVGIRRIGESSDAGHLQCLRYFCHRNHINLLIPRNSEPLRLLLSSATKA